MDLFPGDSALRIHHLQHVSFEGLGTMESYFLLRDHQLSSTHLYIGQSLPSIDEFDWLIVMGGPMGVYDEIKYPWLNEVKSLIQKSINSDKVVLGICLGAQLIADVLGAKVYKNEYREIGWFPIERKINANQSIVADVFPKTLDVFHWHGDTFELPKGAHLLASSEACRNQGFIIEDRVVGLQFHLETTPASAALLIENCRNELDGSKFVQDENEIMANDRKFFRINEIMRLVLEKLEQKST
jgi:GMP synthase (glutamine-hydrolysing)